MESFVIVGPKMTEAAVDREERGDEHLRDSGADWQDVVLSLNLSYSAAIMWHHYKNHHCTHICGF